MKNKKGFTLAETLIALTIVGIIAATTIPQLMVAINKRTAAGMLAKSVRQIEAGCQNMIETANKRSNDGSYFTSILQMNRIDMVGGNDGRFVYNQLFTDYGGYFGVEAITNAERALYNGEIAGYSDGQSEEWVTRLANTGKFKDGKTGVYYALSAVNNPIQSTDLVTNIMDHIFVDVNGAGKPNRFGKDIFLFGLTDRCKIVPAGTALMNNAANGGSGHALADNACVDGNITDGLSCTARVVKDGYKINY